MEETHEDNPFQVLSTASSHPSRRSKDCESASSTDEVSFGDGSSKKSKEKKSKKEKKHKKEKKKKKKKKKSEERLRDGDLEGKLEREFDDFAKLAAAMNMEPPRRSGQVVSPGNSNEWQDFRIETPYSKTKSIATATTGSESHDIYASQMPPLDHPDSPIDNGSDLARLNSEVIQSYLNSHFEDEKIALSTALAFETFLQQQELYSDSVSKQSSQNASSYTEEIEDNFDRSTHSHHEDEEEEEEEYGDDFEDEEFPDDSQNVSEGADFSDVSTLGWSCAEGGNPWSDMSFQSISNSSKIEKQASPVAVEPNSARYQDFNGPTRRIPNRVAAVAASQVRTPTSVVSNTRSLLNNPELFRTFDNQMASLSIDQRNVVLGLKLKWSKTGRPPFPDSWYLKFAQCSPGRPFTAKAAFKVMKSFNLRYMNLSIRNMEQQLLTKTIFPVKGLTSIDGYNMFYMRPSRYFPKLMTVTSVIDNLIYVMDCMMDNEASQRDGIGFVANMTDWTMSNFQVNYCYKFMMGLQGNKSPTRVKLFLIVNPPSWFGSIWRIMKPMFTNEFRKKIHMIPFSRMGEFLAPGFEEYLPDDMYSGRQNTQSIIAQFIQERKQAEIGKHIREAAELHR